MSASTSQNYQAPEELLAVTCEAVPQEDVLAAFACPAEPVLEQAVDSLQAQAKVEDILHPHRIPAPDR